MGARVLYVSAEESLGQVRLRAERTGTLSPNLWLSAETDLAVVLGQIDQVEPQLVIVDSVQTVSTADATGIAGGPGQVREVAASLTRVAKERDLPVLLVGHVTKDGQIAGPRVLEHLVDVVCHFEGDRGTALRFVRAVKNRFGPTDEVGCFEMTGEGIAGVTDPSGLFLSRSHRHRAGHLRHHRARGSPRDPRRGAGARGQVHVAAPPPAWSTASTPRASRCSSRCCRSTAA